MSSFEKQQKKKKQIECYYLLDYGSKSDRSYPSVRLVLIGVFPKSAQNARKSLKDRWPTLLANIQAYKLGKRNVAAPKAKL